MEKIWNYNQNNQKLEKKFETATPTKGIIILKPCDCKHWQADRLLFLLEGTALLPSSGREQELVIRVQKTHTHAIVNILLFLR